MSYLEFLDNIESYIGCVAEFEAKWKASGEDAGLFQRYVWDKKAFSEMPKDSPLEVTSVKIVRG